MNKYRLPGSGTSALMGGGVDTIRMVDSEVPNGGAAGVFGVVGAVEEPGRIGQGGGSLSIGGQLSTGALISGDGGRKESIPVSRSSVDVTSLGER